ncbi:MAG TPA: hypothetical protein VN622_12895 [Clostridia bacterium]|nr:hypothetical protein [Clostridia bacterium]
MAYWRMQLHPDQSGKSVQHCVESLAAGFIGLDFASDTGDLRTIRKDLIPTKEKDHWAFAHDMQQGDWVLIIAHHFPFAVAQITGEYNYIRETEPRIGVWFRHFRRVSDVMYYGDYKTNARDWEQIKMTDTISPLHDTGSKSYSLIYRWTSKAVAQSV